MLTLMCVQACHEAQDLNPLFFETEDSRRVVRDGIRAKDIEHI